MELKYGRIIIYKVKKELSPGVKSRLSQKLLGYRDKSNFAQYTYQRRGVLSSIPHLAPLRGVLIVKAKDVRKVLELLKNKADVFCRKIILTARDKKRLKS